MTWVALDGTTDAYHGIMKLVNLEIVFEDDYKRELTFEVSTTDITNMEICSVNVYSVRASIF